MTIQYIRFITFSVLVFFFACEGEQQSEQSQIPEVIKAVKTMRIESMSNGSERVLAGTTISSDEQSLSFRVSGVIVKLPVQIGDVLKKGDLVAQLDNADYEISVKQAKASVAQSKANEVSAISNYKRTKELYSAQAASLADLESARASADSAKASLAVARQQLNSTSKNLQYTTLRNEAENCRVTAVPTTVNTNISAGSPVVKLSCGDRLRVKVVVPEKLVDQIRMGDKVTVSIPSINKSSVVGEVVEVAVSNNNAAGFDVEVELKENVPELRVGVAASVILQVENGTANEVVILSSHVVLEDANGNFVYILTDTDVDNVFLATRKTVEVGELQNAGLTILSGLKRGDEVIISGVSRVTNNMKVKRMQ